MTLAENDVKKRKIRKLTMKYANFNFTNVSSFVDFNIKNFFELLETYLSSTHLHGCRYIVDRKYNILAPIYWIILISLCFTFCVHLIFLQLSRFEDSAVLNVITSTSYPVWKSPFPAVIICNHNVVYENNTKEIKSILEQEGVREEDIEEFFSNLPNLIVCDGCLDNATLFDVPKNEQIYQILEKFGYNITKLMKEVTYPCKNLLKKCKWRAEEIPCTDLFKSVKTTLGYCCGFNYFGTIAEQEQDKKLYFAGGSGTESGLRVVINFDLLEYESNYDFMPRVTIFVHNSFKYPQTGMQTYSLVAGESIKIRMYQSTFKSASDIVKLDVRSRKCLFENEGDLHWSKIYDMQTCFNECKANYIWKVCNCTPFYYPTKENVSICTFADIPCLTSNEGKFANIMLSNDIDADMEFMLQQGITDPEFCHCLPNCDDVSYNFHTDKVSLENNNTCILNVHYDSVGGILRMRTVTVSWDTLLGTIGGTFGLCMGGSVISLLEFIFYFLQALFGRGFIQKRKQRAVVPHKLIKVSENTKIHSLHM